jgi:hypothetical protein
MPHNRCVGQPGRAWPGQDGRGDLARAARRGLPFPLGKANDRGMVAIRQHWLVMRGIETLGRVLVVAALVGDMACSMKRHRCDTAMIASGMPSL